MNKRVMLLFFFSKDNILEFYHFLCLICIIVKYSRTSVARTLMALPWLSRTLS